MYIVVYKDPDVFEYDDREICKSSSLKTIFDSVEEAEEVIDWLASVGYSRSFYTVKEIINI